jgi:predicted permease
MRRARALLRRLLNVFGSSRAEHDLSAEIESHLQLHTDDNIRAGMTPVEARRRAIIALGGVEPVKEAIRDRRGVPLVESLLRDLRLAARTLRRDAAVTTFAVLILGIGVGVSTTMFSVVNALWLRPLPFSDPERLVWIANGRSENLSSQSVQVGHLVDLREQSQSFDGLEGFSLFYGAGDVRLTGAGDAERSTAVPVTEGLFPLLGLHPWLGRNFTAEESKFGAPRTAIASHTFWQRRMGASVDVIGSSITLDGEPTIVIGVLPPWFDFAGTFSPGRPADLFVPFPQSAENNRRGNLLALIGRLKPSLDVTAAQAETAATVARIVQVAPDVESGRRRNPFDPILSPLRDRISGRFNRPLMLLAAAAVLLMVLVSANISSLLLARAAARRREMAMHMALGAGRGRLVRQLLVEAVVLSATGAAAGLVMAFAATSVIARLEGAGIPLLPDVRVDGLAVLFTASIAVITGVGFGVLPALQASRSNPQEAFKDAGRTVTGAHGWMRRAIVVTEVALVCVLLIVASLLARSLSRVLEVDPGFTAANLLTLRVDPSRKEHPTREARNAYFDALLQRVRSVPGVEAAGLTDALPFGDNFGWRGWTITSRDVAADAAARHHARVRMVDDAYLPAMRIGMRAGRGFTTADGPSSAKVVVINSVLAQSVWPNVDPLGRVLRASGVDYRVAGVVNDVRYFNLERATGAEMYMLIGQTGDYTTVDLVVRSALPPARLIPSLRAALREADPSLPSIDFRTMEQLVDRSVFARRVIARTLAGFAGFGLLLASLGLYAVIAYSVNQRGREIGVRMALGAAPLAMQRQVLGQTLMLAAMGMAIGVPAAWMAAKALQSLLFGVVSSDPVTFAGVTVVVPAVAALAGLLPARRASRIDPMLALRLE